MITRSAAVACLAILAMGAAATTNRADSEEAMSIRSITPLLYVEEIEPSLPFWERLGFTREAEVPEGDRLGFVILKHGNTQIMYQTRASVAADVSALADTPMGGTLLFIEVEDLVSIEKSLGDAPVIFPKRTTFYGATEIGVREPAGNAVTFAQFSR